MDLDSISLKTFIASIVDSITYIPHTKEQYSFNAKIEPKYKITNKLIDTIINMKNEFQIKNPLLLSKLENKINLIESNIAQELIDIVLDPSKDDMIIAEKESLMRMTRNTILTSSSIFNNLEYYEKVQIVRLLERMEKTEEWSDFSRSMKLDDIDPGSNNKIFFEISAEYGQIYNGLDKEEKVYQIYDGLNKEERDLRNKEEKINKRIQIGSLEKNITNGNWRD